MFLLELKNKRKKKLMTGRERERNNCSNQRAYYFRILNAHFFNVLKKLNATDE